PRPPHAAARTIEARALPIPRRPGFEINRGQWPAPVAYVARDAQATLFLTLSEAVWQLRTASAPAPPSTAHATDAPAVHMRWTGANTAPTVDGSAVQRARVNYARGNNSAAWHFDVPLYARVTYRDVYPGIDLVFHDQRGE